MWKRYEGYSNGRELLLSMASFCLDVLERSSGYSRKRAAKRHKIEFAVLDKLGQMAANLGDNTTARKLSAQSELRPLTPQEERWVRAVVLAMIRRAGEVAANPQQDLPKLTMVDLPVLGAS
jgi:hypothetical protein